MPEILRGIMGRLPGAGTRSRRLERERSIGLERERIHKEDTALQNYLNTRNIPGQLHEVYTDTSGISRGTSSRYTPIEAWYIKHANSRPGEDDGEPVGTLIGPGYALLPGLPDYYLALCGLFNDVVHEGVGDNKFFKKSRTTWGAWNRLGDNLARLVSNFNVGFEARENIYHNLKGHPEMIEPQKFMKGSGGSTSF